MMGDSTSGTALYEARLVLALALRELRFDRAQHAASVVVAVLGALLGTLLIESEAILQQQSAAGGFDVHPFVRLLLGVLGIIFVAVATLVAVIVTANTFSIVMAGRAKGTALLRLLGASARTLRGAVTVEGMVVGLAGSLLGVAIGIGLTAAISGALMEIAVFRPVAMDYVPWPIIFPLVTGTVSMALAGFIGARSVVQFSPIASLGHSREFGMDAVLVARGRLPLSFALVGAGALLMAGGVAIGYSSPYGLMLAVPGGALSFVGFVSSSSVFLPPVLAVVGKAMGHSAATELATANATRYPARTARSTVSLVIGITLVTMFGVAGQTYFDLVRRVMAGLPARAQHGTSPFFDLVLGVIGILVGFSIVIAAVGLVNAQSLSVLQRRREIGLLRALGLTRPQVRRMIVAESVQLTVTGTICGIVLGTVYGWVGALATLSSEHDIGGYFWFSFPIWLLVGIIVAAGVLAVVASIIPSRRATRVSPVVAAAVD